MSRSSLGIWIFAVSLLLVPRDTMALSRPLHDVRDPREMMGRRVEELIDRLSLEEKASLMLYDSPAVERLGIPACNWWNEALHGVARAGKATVFPQVIGLAATFDEDLVFRVADAVSDEARAKHNSAAALGGGRQYTGLTFWSPNINIYRDPRWGRGQETFGEDPFLSSRLGGAYVRGMQGEDPFFLKTAACAKHFVVHSGPEVSRHELDARPEEIDFHETYLPAFRALVKGGVAGVMCAYNRLDGLPCCGSGKLLTDLLRRDWGFSGYIVSDCWALQDFITHQKIMDNGIDAAVLALKAGVNLNCGVNYRYIPDAVRLGKISEKEIDALLRPLLQVRYRLGLLGDKDTSPFHDIGLETLDSEGHRLLAREAARKSIVLLKNGRQLLPLKGECLRKIYLTGPTMADPVALLGNYHGLSAQLVTFLEGIVHRLGPGTVADYTMGTPLAAEKRFSGSHLAEEADVVIVAIGFTSLLEGENGDAFLSDSGGDRPGLGLPANQLELLRRLRDKMPQKPLVVVVTAGGAVDLGEICSLADAVLFAWYPGEEGGNALADILFGDVSPSGRLPVTFTAREEDLPPFDDYSMAQRSYRFFQGKALFPFGYGLSYTRFLHSNVKAALIGRDVAVSLTLENKGTFAGDELVQVYAVKPARHRRNPIRSLCGVRRVFLRPGERKNLDMNIRLEHLAAWDVDSDRFVLTPGRYVFQVGPNSRDLAGSAFIDLN